MSYALTGRPGVGAETRQRVLAAAEELGWYPSSSARALSGARRRRRGPGAVPAAGAAHLRDLLRAPAGRAGDGAGRAGLEPAAAGDRRPPGGGDPHLPALVGGAPHRRGDPARRAVPRPAGGARSSELRRARRAVRRSAAGLDDAGAVDRPRGRRGRWRSTTCTSSGTGAIAHVSGPIDFVHERARRRGVRRAAARRGHGRRDRRGRLHRAVGRASTPPAAAPPGRRAADRDRLRQRRDGRVRPDRGPRARRRSCRATSR